MKMSIFYYIYYNFYNMAKKNNSVLPPQFVALVCVLALEIWLIMGVLNEIYFLLDIRLLPYSIKNINSIIILLSLVCINLYIFEFRNKVKNIIQNIEQNKNKVKIRVAWFVAVAIVVNYWFISLYFLSLKSQ